MKQDFLKTTGNCKPKKEACESFFFGLICYFL